MEFKRDNNRYDGRHRLVVPGRGGATPSPSSPAPSPKPKDEVAAPKNLAADRELFGFDDIPVDDSNVEDVSFRDIVRAWTKQAIKHSPLDKRLKDNAAKTKRLKEVKNDIKWALMADLDEPPAPTRRPSPPKHQPTPPRQAANSPVVAPAEHKTIDINISLGSLPKLNLADRLKSGLVALRQQIDKLSKKQKLIIVGVIVALIIALFVLPLLKERFGIFGGGSGNYSSESGAQTPEYSTVTPSGKSINELGGWKRVSPPGRAPAFAYADKLQDVPINVTQQPIPDSFKGHVDDSVAELAKNYLATEKVSAGSTTVYIGTSGEESHSQSVIFVKNNLLILIKSTHKIDGKVWSEYVQSLT